MGSLTNRLPRALVAALVLTCGLMPQIARAQSGGDDERLVLRGTVEPAGLRLSGAGSQGVAMRGAYAVEQGASQAADQRPQSRRGQALLAGDEITITGPALAAVTTREGQIELDVQLGWSDRAVKARTLVDLRFAGKDQIGLALIGQTLQLYGMFGGQYRHSFFPSLVIGPDSPRQRIALCWSYADGYTLVACRVNGEEVASIFTGLGSGGISALAIGGKTGTGKFDLEPLSLASFELSSAVRFERPPDPAAGLPPSAVQLPGPPQLTLLSEQASRKVKRQQDWPALAQAQALQVELARNETEAVQLVLSARRSPQQVQVELGSWTQTPAGSTASAEPRVELLLVEDVTVAFPSGPWGEAGQLPDPLPPLHGALTLLPDEHRAIWVSVTASANTAPGAYERHVRLRGDGWTWDVPLRMTVRRFALPRQPTQDTAARLNERFLPPGQEEAYYRNLAAHRINGLVGARALEALSKPNWSQAALEKADREIKLLVHELGFRHVSLTGIGWVSHRGTHRWLEGTSWFGTPHFEDDSPQSPVISRRMAHAFTQHMQRVVSFLQERDAVDAAILYYQDEMDWDDPATLARSTAMARFLRGIAPQVRILQTKYPHADLMPYTAVWCMHAQHVAPHSAARQAAHEQGAKIWIYHNTIPAIDYPSIRSRLFPWLIWKMKLDGTFSYWSVNEWLEDPWTQKWSGIAGSGVLLYPGRSPQEPGPITSMRWELLRDGLEDVEYLAMLERCLSEGLVDEARRPAAEALLLQSRDMTERLPRVIGLGDQPYSLDVVKLTDIRSRVGDLLDQLVEAKLIPED